MQCIHTKCLLAIPHWLTLKSDVAYVHVQVVHDQLNADQTAAKRLCLDPSAAAEQAPSTSLQLSGHGPSTVAADKDQEAMSQPLEAAAAGAAHQHKQHLQQHQHSSLRPPLPQPPGNSTQQQLAQHPQHMGTGKHAGQAGSSRHGKHTAVPTSSTSTGPCRTDLSGQLVVIQQELNSNTTGDHSNSTYSQLLLQHPLVQQPAAAAAGSDCSHGTHPANAAAAAEGHQQCSDLQVQQQHSQQQQQQSRKRSRPSCQYGNYHHYYGYRLKPSGFEDPRLKVCTAS